MDGLGDRWMDGLVDRQTDEQPGGDYLAARAVCKLMDGTQGLLKEMGPSGEGRKEGWMDGCTDRLTDRLGKQIGGGGRGGWGSG